MAYVIETIELDAQTNAVWSLIGDFARFGWHPAVERIEISPGPDGPGQPGTRRTLHLHGGGELVEERTGVGSDPQSYGYVAISGPLPVVDYRATLRVGQLSAGRSQVEWKAQFNAVGMDDAAAEAVISGALRAGLDALPSLLAQT